MALPNHEVILTTPIQEILLVDVEDLESTRATSLHRFIVKHSNITEDEYGALQIADVNTVTAKLLADLQKASLPLAKS
jgi:hypothetical protein